MKELASIGRMKLYSGLIGTTAVWVDDNTIGISLQEEDEFKNRILSEDGNITAIKGAIKRCTGKELQVIVLNNERKKKRG